MGRISTYERDGVITDNDRLLGSNYINGTYNTANYKISDLVSYLDGRITIAAIDDNTIGADELNISGNGSAGNVLISDGDGSFSWSSSIPTLTSTSTLTNKTLTSPTITGSGAIAGVFTGNITGTVLTATQGTIDHDSLSGFVANEHIDWTADQGSTNIHTGNYTNTTYSIQDGELSQNNFTNADHTKLDGIEASADVTDTTNVTAAGALMDSEVTNLADVKAFDTTDYATAAQGAKADSAQQPPSEGAFANGDKTKLDGIEASADVTDATNVTAAGALMDSELTDLAGVKGVTISTLQVKPSEGAFANGDKTKLDGIEASATADQTNAEIRAAVEAATDSNVFTDDDHSKLNAVEASATADQTDAEIRAAVEAATDSNVFTDADHTKLNAIEALADVTDTTNVTAAGALMDSELAGIAAVKATTGTFLLADETKLDGIEASADVTDTANVTSAGALMDSELTNLAAVKAINQGLTTSSNVSFGNITTTGYLRGPASFTIDPATHGDDTGTVVIAGNIQVDGTTTTINSTTVAIDDLNFSIATDAADSAAANGAGITIGGASATLTYAHADTSWNFNKPLNVTGAGTFAGHILPSADSTYNLGSSSVRFAAVYIDSLSTLLTTTMGGNLQLQSTVQVLNKAQTSYINLAARDTSGGEVVYNLSNLGTATFAGTITGNLTGDVTGDVTGNADTATLASTVTVTDSNTDTDFPVVFHNESNALLDDTGSFEYNPSISGTTTSRLTLASARPQIALTNTSGSNIDYVVENYAGHFSIQDGTSNLFQILVDSGQKMAKLHDNWLSINTSANPTVPLDVVGDGKFTGDVNITQTTDVGVLNVANLDSGAAVGLSLTYPTSNVAAGDGLAIAIGVAGRGRSYIANSNVTNNLDASNLVFYTEGGGTIVEALKLDTNQNATFAGDVTANSIFLPNNRDIGWDGGYSASKPTLAAVGTTMKMFPSGATSGAQFELTPTTATFSGKMVVGDATNQQQWIVNKAVAGYYSGIKLTRGAGDNSSTNANNHAIWVSDTGLNFGKTNDATVDAFSNVSTHLTLNASGDATFAGHVALADGKQLNLGTDTDMVVVHDGSDGYIKNNTGELIIVNYANDKDIKFYSDDGNNNTFEYFFLDGSAATYSGATTAAYTVWPDKSRIALGGGKDLQLYHDGSNSYIRNQIGWLNVPLHQNGISIANSDFSASIARFLLGGACELYHNGTKQLETTAAGVTFANEISAGDDINTTGKFFANATNAELRLKSTNNSTGTSLINFADPDDNDVGQIKYLHGNNEFQFRSTDALALTLDYDAATFAGNISHQGLTPTAGTDIDQIYTASVSLTVTTAWQDTGINATDLATGTYIVQLYTDDHGTNSIGHYTEYYSGIMSWYSTDTNSTDTDEIILHRAGHAPNHGDIFLRTERTGTADTNDMSLQIKTSNNASGAATYVFKFRRMI